MLPQCCRADGFCCGFFPGLCAQDDQRQIRGQGCSGCVPATPGRVQPWMPLGRWHQTLVRSQSQPGRMLRSHHHHPRPDEGAAGTDPSREGDWGAGWHPPTRPMTIVSRGSSSSVLPGLGKPRWVSEGHPKRAILWAPAERAGGVSAFFCADKEPEGAGAQPGTGGHGTRGGEPTAMRTLRSTARGSQALGQNLGGHPAFAGGVTGSPGTALCTPAAFQAKPPPTCCVNTAGAWRSHFSSTQLWREAQHLPLTMRLTHSQTPGSLRLLLGMLPAPWPPHSPVCPHHGSCCPPRHPPPGQKLNPWWGNQPSSWPWVVSLGFYLALIHPGLKV